MSLFLMIKYVVLSYIQKGGIYYFLFFWEKK